MQRARRSIHRLVAVMLLVQALSGGRPAAADDPGPVVRPPCDPLDPAHCLLPFPNDRFTRHDPTSGSGRRIDLQLIEMPRSVAGKPIDPTEWNRNDGFSPGSMLLTFVPGLDLHRTWGSESLTGDRVGGPNDPRDHIAAPGRYLADDAPILVIDAVTGERWPFWSELDRNAMTAADERLLIIRPAMNFLESHRYLVALRRMRDAGGNLIPAGASFAAYRDGSEGPLTDPGSESRRADVNRVIDEIEAAEEARGNAFDRSELYLAWEFTVASRRNLSERVLHIRDEAFAELGDTNLGDTVVQGAAPEFRITAVVDRSNDGARLRQVEGTITVPNYLDRPPLPPVEEVETPIEDVPGQAIPGGRFVYGPDGLPEKNPLIPTIEAPFVCTIPKARVPPTRCSTGTGSSAAATSRPAARPTAIASGTSCHAPSTGWDSPSTTSRTRRSRSSIPRTCRR